MPTAKLAAPAAQAPNAPGLSIHPQPSPEQAAAIAAALAVATQPLSSPAPEAPPAWRMAARVEGLAIVRRLNTQLDMRLMGAPTRERFARPSREGR